VKSYAGFGLVCRTDLSGIDALILGGIRKGHRGCRVDEDSEACAHSISIRKSVVGEQWHLSPEGRSRNLSSLQDKRQLACCAKLPVHIFMFIPRSVRTPPTRDNKLRKARAARQIRAEA
jgi:hypothetical protein